MSETAVVWLVILVLGVVGAFALFKGLQPMRWGLPRWLLMFTAFAFFLTPARVPEHTDQIAPAFVVAIFEMFFQIEGSPEQSLKLLGLVMLTVALLTTIAYFFLQQKSANKSRRKTAKSAKNNTQTQS